MSFSLPMPREEIHYDSNGSKNSKLSQKKIEENDIESQGLAIKLNI